MFLLEVSSYNHVVFYVTNDEGVQELLVSHFEADDSFSLCGNFLAGDPFESSCFRGKWGVPDFFIKEFTYDRGGGPSVN